MNKRSATIAYFSMEIGIRHEMPTYSGGLGVLAGDTIRAAADYNVPMVAVTLLHRRGYINQHISPEGWQTEEPENWLVDSFVSEMPERSYVTIEGRRVNIRSWLYSVKGENGHTVHVYFLDSDIEGNSDWDRALTHYLYGGDDYYRLCQEVILGIGGVRMLRALGYNSIQRFHMNEGHSSLLSLELLSEEAKKSGRSSFNRADIEAVRNKCIFTTHTPVPAGHDKFPMDMVARVLGHRREFIDMKDVFTVDLVSKVIESRNEINNVTDLFNHQNILNMTYLALNMSSYINGVAKRHAEISKLMYAGYIISSITNGVHPATWVSEPFRELFDRYISGWKLDNFSLRYATGIGDEQIWNAHVNAKHRLIDYVNRETGCGMDYDCLTIGFARRATAYKRASLLFQDTDRLRHIAKSKGGLQIIYSGKAHPRDYHGKEIIKQIYDARLLLGNDIRIAYLKNYNMRVAGIITSGVDLWLNTPLPPNEASGTSGMKCALNGIPSLSVLDGWWIEGHIEDVTGWSLGNESPESDHLSLYDKLENLIVPMFYNDRDRYIQIMKNCIAVNGSFFNTERMIKQYTFHAYRNCV